MNADVAPGLPSATAASESDSPSIRSESDSHEEFRSRLRHAGEEQHAQRVAAWAQGLGHLGVLLQGVQVGVRRGDRLASRGLEGGPVAARRLEARAVRVLATVQDGFQRLGRAGQNQPLAENRMRLLAIERPDRHAPHLPGRHGIGPAVLRRVVARPLDQDLVQPAQQRLVPRVHDQQAPPPGKTALVTPPSRSLYSPGFQSVPSCISRTRTTWTKFWKPADSAQAL